MISRRETGPSKLEQARIDPNTPELNRPARPRRPRPNARGAPRPTATPQKCNGNDSTTIVRSAEAPRGQTYGKPQPAPFHLPRKPRTHGWQAFRNHNGMSGTNQQPQASAQAGDESGGKVAGGHCRICRICRIKSAAHSMNQSGGGKFRQGAGMLRKSGGTSAAKARKAHDLDSRRRAPGAISLAQDTNDLMPPHPSMLV